MRKIPFAPLLLATLVGAAAAPALAADAPPTGAQHACHHHRHHHHRPHSAFFRALHKLDLSDAQKQTLRADFKAARGTLKPQWQALRSARRNFDHTMPGSAEYGSAQTALQQAATSMVQARLQMQAQLRQKIVGTLTDAQRARLIELLSQNRGN
jgi:hypothetical protein